VGGGGVEAYSGPSKPMGIKYKWKAVGIQVKLLKFINNGKNHISISKSRRRVTQWAHWKL